MKTIIALAILIASLFIMNNKVLGNYYSTINLNGTWKFSIGDNPQWSSPTFNDSNWDNIKVPSRWEEEGYHGYNGIAWYRKTINLSDIFSNREVFIELGYIDDCDEVFFNGIKIGQSGSFPPNYSTAYNSFRKYLVPANLLKYNQLNTIAVRVYDSQLEGGIIRGDIKIGIGNIAVVPDISLNGTWDFSTNRKSSYSTTIQVPGRWEDQGYNSYDGIAVYTKTVKFSIEQLKKNWIFLAGRIDDMDEFYINGKLVAKTGDFNNGSGFDSYNEFRNYFIPDNILKIGDNKLELRVKDTGGEGGIIEGNIGFITQENFIKFWRLKRNQ